MLAKRVLRERIWNQLQAVAIPDSRFHMRFAEFIPDFIGSDVATQRCLDDARFAGARHVFVTPDNSLDGLRQSLIENDVSVVVSTHGMARGFFWIKPGSVPRSEARFAAWLDGLEYFGQPVTLEALSAMGRFDAIVTGASAVTTHGVRFGRGHGFLDLEWLLFAELGIVDDTTPIWTLVHDVQVVEEGLFPSERDVVLDAIATPTRTLEIARETPRPSRIDWRRLDQSRIDAMPPLREWQRALGLA
ncbi:5-formyltetrahydrofolate cyclo-ligase [Salinicola avicenniae]|uniref:5-formyltetrahydrofolate cyclo-ligase n=1 Tax=Salinicola avicenniae TaxID=2916836 RepID=UPI002072AF85|nr:5-formyltetrahydrofolate cyclo-ligase [Salinicola sp. S1-1-8]